MTSSPVIDALCLVGPSLFGVDQDPDALVVAMAATGVSVSIVAANRPPGYLLAPANEWLARVCRRSAGRLVGLARVDPNHAEGCDDARAALATLGLRGLFLHPHEEAFPIDHPRTDAVVEVAGEHEVPVVISAGWPWQAEALQVAELARRHPQTSFVMTNGGQFNISGLGQFDAELALRRCPNLVVLTNGLYRQDFIERAVAEFGPRRVLFASASPQFDLVYELLRVQRAEVASEDERAQMLGGGAAELFRLVP